MEFLATNAITFSTIFFQWDDKYLGYAIAATLKMTTIQPNRIPVYLTNSRLVLEIDESSSFELSWDTCRSVHVFVYIQKCFTLANFVWYEDCTDVNNVNVGEVTIYQKHTTAPKTSISAVCGSTAVNSRHLLFATWNGEEILEMLESIALGHPIRYSQDIWLLSFSVQAANVILSKSRHAGINKNQKHMFYCATQWLFYTCEMMFE